MDDQLDEDHRPDVEPVRRGPLMQGIARQDAAEGEECDRRCRIGEHVHRLAHDVRQHHPARRNEHATRCGPGQRVGRGAAQRLGKGAEQGGAPALAGFVPRVRDGETQRTDEDDVDREGQHRAADRLLAEQGKNQRNAHEAAVGEGGDQRAESRILDADARVAAQMEGRQRQHDATAGVEGEQLGVEQASDRRRRAKAEEHRREAEVEHVAADAGHRAVRNDAAAHGKVAAGNQGEEGKSDIEDRQHGRSGTR